MIKYEERQADHKRQEEDSRSEYDVDYGRIIHSASFRRLQGKTQILNLGDSDFYRTRLTHTLEVSQIATGIIRHFYKQKRDHLFHKELPSDALIQSICLTHDLGHPPFGHGGEVALNFCMKDNGGFEGNAQTLRILTRLEKYSENTGSNLTRRTLLGVLKYPAQYSAVLNRTVVPCWEKQESAIKMINREKSKPPKCYFDGESDIVKWLLRDIEKNEQDLFVQTREIEKKHRKTLHKSFDSSVMEVADDIAYGVHDLEDAISLKLITKDHFVSDVSESICAPFLNKLSEKYPSKSRNNVYEDFVRDLFSDSATRKRQISRLVFHFITHTDIVEEPGFSEPLLKYRAKIDPEVKAFLGALQKIVRERVILSPNVQHLEFKGQNMVISVFEVMASDPKAFLPVDAYARYQEDGNNIRVICDYIAGMTDHYLLKTYDRLFSPRMGSVFDKL